MKQHQYKMIASSYAFFIKKNNILLSRRFQTGYADGKLSVPAGHVEDGETITQALIREMREEVGITLIPSQFLLSHIMHRKSDDIRIDFFFRINSWSGTLKNMEPEKCNQLVWTPLDALPRDVVPYVSHAIHCVCKNIFYSEFGWK
ncbi:MAG: NUDIX domain-containing protein [Candidatus Gottesmanbacteria bacterium]